jgi:hypothetical protein
MDKLDKIGAGNAPIQPQNTKVVFASDYNKVVEKINDIIDNTTEFNYQSVTSYTLKLIDVNKYIQLDNANPITLTVPPFIDVAIPIGASLTLEQTGVGAFTVTAGSGVTLHGNVLSNGQYTIIVLIKTSINKCSCIGGTV